MRNNNTFSYLLVFACHLSIFFDLKLFAFTYLLFVTYIILFDRSLKKNLIFFYKLLPVTYYLINFYKLFSDNLNSVIFWDMQNFLHYLKCNSSNVVYFYKFNNYKELCPETIGYGPLTEFLLLGNIDIWLATQFLAIMFVIINLYFLLICKKNILLIVTILISPAFQFLFYSLNSDIFVLCYVVWLIKENNYKKININIFVLILLSLIKTYPIFLLLGLLGVSYIKENKFDSFKIFISILFSVSFLVQHYIINQSVLPVPISFTRSFGVLHDLKLVMNFIGYDEVSYLFLIFIFTMVIFRNKLKISVLNNSLNFPKKTIEKIIILLPTLYVINFYQNWGYKFMFNSILFVLIFNYVPKKQKLFILFCTLISSTYFLIGYGYTNSILNLITISLSKMFFYSLIIYKMYITFTIYKTQTKKN